jgi:hypothetical protein
MASLAPAEKAPSGPPLKVGSPHDPAEREADRIADLLTAPEEPAMPVCTACAAGGAPCAACGGGDGGGVLRRQLAAGGDGGSGGEMVAPPSVHRVLSEPGEPLPAGSRGKFERRLGVDLGGVRVHSNGPHATASSNAVDALAYTVGSDIVFAHGAHDQQSPKGHRLLAHELAHVVQQTSPAKRVATTPGSEPDTPTLAPVARSIQRTACQDAARLHAVRAGRPVPAATEPTAESQAAEDASWAAAASAIDFAATVLESPVGRGILSMLPGPVGMVGGSSTPSSLRLVLAVLPEIRSVWDLLSNPARLMALVRAFVDSHLDGVPEIARARLAGAAFEALRNSRHMAGIGFALADAVADLLANWTTPFVTAWNTFIAPCDVGAEMADLACIQERYAAREIDTFEAYSAIYGWLVGLVNRYSVYVALALVLGGGVIGALGGGTVGGAVGGVAGGAPAAPGAAGGGAAGFTAGAGAGWAIAEEIGIAILAANAVSMLLTVAAAIERLKANDRLAEADAAAGRTPSEAELAWRSGQEELAYTQIAHVIVGLGIMGALVLTTTFGPHFARLVMAALARAGRAVGRRLAPYLAAAMMGLERVPGMRSGYGGASVVLEEGAAGISSSAHASTVSASSPIIEAPSVAPAVAPAAAPAVAPAVAPAAAPAVAPTIAPAIAPAAVSPGGAAITLAPIAGATNITLSQSAYADALRLTYPSMYANQIMVLVDQIGEAAAVRAMANPRFVAAMNAGNATLAGTFFHSAAATVANNLPPGSLPPGWTLVAEDVVQSGAGGSRIDLLFRGPNGERVEVDWKTSGGSALSTGSRAQMIRHAGQILANLGGTLSAQQSRSWMQIIRRYWIGPWPF